LRPYPSHRSCVDNFPTLCSNSNLCSTLDGPYSPIAPCLGVSHLPCIGLIPADLFFFPSHLSLPPDRVIGFLVQASLIAGDYFPLPPFFPSQLFPPHDRLTSFHHATIPLTASCPDIWATFILLRVPYFFPAGLSRGPFSRVSFFCCLFCDCFNLDDISEGEGFSKGQKFSPPILYPGFRRHPGLAGWCLSPFWSSEKKGSSCLCLLSPWASAFFFPPPRVGRRWSVMHCFSPPVFFFCS